MKPRLTWTHRECGSGKTCAGEARHTKLPGGRIIQGYTITDPEVLADLGPAPAGEVFAYLPDDLPEV
ncbi:MAG TPA: hypothetical protein VM307_05990 [Egibacteraceae bacterium]|jgi:hypothetical protein|nr:hypothetical protein [Egibacteraceae bacterium]